MKRHTRYQGAITRGPMILLIRHRHHEDGRTYWLLPGGGREEGEGEEDCLRREMFEETGVQVRIERLLFDEIALPGGVYQHMKTYLCSIESGEPSPGYEPEEEVSVVYGIVEVGWFDLRDPSTWGERVYNDRFTYPIMLKIKAELGF